MKQVFFAICLGLTLGFVACSGSDKEEAKTGEATAAEAPAATAKTMNVDAATSKVNWTGFGVGHNHTGTLAIKEGTVAVENGNVTGGKFTFDMSKIEVNDGTKDEGLTKLMGHLTKGFFATDSFPTSSFEITKAEALTGNPEATHTITGNLTLRGITKSLSFPAKVTINGNEVATTASFKFNRTLWNVMENSKDYKMFDIKKYADHAVDNDIELKLDIKAKG